MELMSMKTNSATKRSLTLVTVPPAAAVAFVGKMRSIGVDSFGTGAPSSQLPSFDQSVFTAPVHVCVAMTKRASSASTCSRREGLRRVGFDEAFLRHQVGNIEIHLSA